MKRAAAIFVLVCSCHNKDEVVPHVDITTTPPAASSIVASPSPMPSESASADPPIAVSPRPSASVENFGMLGLLSSGDPNAPTAPWGRDSLGAGDGGRGEGIGLGNIGTLGHGAGTGTTQSFGQGRARPSPKIRQGTTSVNGRLPPEVIQRIVRQNFGRFRLCYEQGLARDPKLAGTVATKFVIDTKGDVSNVSRDNSTTLGDANTVSCITRGFNSLSFPQPEAGIVTVIYPIILEPPDTP